MYRKKGLFKSGVFGFFTALLMPFIAAIFMVADDGSGTTDEDKLIEKISAKTKEDMKAIKAEFKETADNMKKGLITEGDFKAKNAELVKKLEDIDSALVEKYESALKTITELKATSDKQGQKINELTDGGMPSKSETLQSQIEVITKSDSFKECILSGGKKKAEFKIDKAVSIVDDYIGTSRVHITTRDGRVVDYPEVIRLNVRDLLTVAPTDMPYLAFSEVVNWDRAVSTVDENGALPESAFQLQESTVGKKRIGTHIPISKDSLDSISWLNSHLAVQLPAQVKYFEDFLLLHGDGQGNNPLGIFKVADDFATVVNNNPTGVAGDVTSIASYDSGNQTLVNFTADQNLKNGDLITFAATTGAIYDNTYTAIVISPKQIMIEQAYTADAGVLANWTFVVNSPFKNAIDAAQEIDVLKVANTLVTVQEYTNNGYVLNPVDVTKIETLKGNDEHYLSVERLENGVLTIGGVRVVETTAMPAGKFACGDWRLAASLLEFRQLKLEFSESTNEKLTNSIEVIIQETILFPIYNKYMFIKGDFVSAKAAILKPA